MSTMRVRGTLDTREYERGVQRMKGKNREFGTGVDRLKSRIKRAFAVAAIIAFARAVSRAVMRLVEFGSQLTDNAMQTGVSVGALQEFQAAARDAGASTEQLTNGLTRLRRAQGDAISGNEASRRAFERLSISMDEVARMDVEGLFRRVSQAVTEAGNSAESFGAASEVVGSRNLPKLLEAMNAISNAGGKVDDTLVKLSERNAQALDMLSDKWARFKNNVTAFFATQVARGVRSIFGEGEVDERIASDRRMKELEERTRIEALATTEREKQAEIAAKIADEERKLLEQRMTAEARIRDQREAGIKRIEESARLQIDTDPVRRMGGFAGAMVSEQLMIARRQADIQASIRDFTATLPQIENNTRERGLR